MTANHTSGLVLLSRTLADHFTTPTASTFAASRNGSHEYACDEGDILDDLVGPTHSRPRLLRPTIHDVDDEDSVSTCSSVTAGADNDKSSVSSRGRSQYSDITSVTSISESGSVAPSKAIGGGLPSNAGAGGGGRNGRRRRRRNNRGQSSVAASEAASETAYKTASVADSVTPNELKSRNNKTRSAKTATVKTNSRNRDVKSANPGRDSSPGPVVRRSRNATNGPYSHEAASTRDSNNKPRRSRHPRLIIGLDLDAEMELKSKVQGDICLTLVMEEEAKRAPRKSPELRLKKTNNGRLVAEEDDRYEDADDVESEDESELEDSVKIKGLTEKTKTKSTERQSKESAQEPKPAPSNTDNGDRQAGSTRKGRREICHMRIGRFNLSRRWWMDGFELIGRVPPPVIVFTVASLPVVGFAAGWIASSQWNTGSMVCV
ncbi:hypothetical protein CMQ_8164 [Grosmannia clavigera kw1407]|uniref:Uncharacterized protein n=1 Tax=Grosmannia clavigera (strain kw1407 / UAMH 11150) TaxID=655863 RepID=F0XKT1_GROCL|nr:uncharacterized protein CMQ_8164 [Grosmannia clavigera kw1407]EFX01698.1 hypothetical protein CMQ_8164 [Grosmannia clavigera kw1407]